VLHRNHEHWSWPQEILLQYSHRTAFHDIEANVPSKGRRFPVLWAWDWMGHQIPDVEATPNVSNVKQAVGLHCIKWCRRGRQLSQNNPFFTVSVPFSIHEFIEITGQLMFINTSHAFQFYLNSVGFHVMDMDSTRGDKLYGMVTEPCLLTLCTWLFVSPYDCSVSHMLLNVW